MKYPERNFPNVVKELSEAEIRIRKSVELIVREVLMVRDVPEDSAPTSIKNDLNMINKLAEVASKSDLT